MNLKSALYFFSIISVIISTKSFSQDAPILKHYLDYSQETKRFIVGGIQIVGSKHKDPNAIKSIIGLKEGNAINMPDDKISLGVRKLLNLRLFEDVAIQQDSIIGEKIFFTVILKERPVVSIITIKGVGKGQHTTITDLVKKNLKIGGIASENSTKEAIHSIQQYYIEKGFYDVRVTLQEKPDTSSLFGQELIFDINKKSKVKIDQIVFVGNNHISDKKLRKILKSTKQKKAFLRSSKLIKIKYEEDKKLIIDEYIKQGFIDAKIHGDSIWRNHNGERHNIAIFIDEGIQYVLGKISWKGNTLYTSNQLSHLLGLKSGDIYNKELIEKRLQYSPDNKDVSSLYTDRGHLFFRVEPKEVSIDSNIIDIEMRMYEGPQATIDKVVIRGNDRTDEAVIRRAIRVQPGKKFSRADLIRSQRELINLGYFDPEKLGLNTPVNWERGTVDVEFDLEEKPSDQLELAAGYGGYYGLTGTFGLTFNNFSLKNIGNKSSWSPLPTGGGQTLALRLQSNGRFQQTLNFSFTDPWFRGKRPNSFTVGANYSKYDYGNSITDSRIYIGYGSSLKWPDDYFVSNSIINIGYIKSKGLTSIADGKYKNFSFQQTFSRNSIVNPIYPQQGSVVSLTLKITPPWSKLRGTEDFSYSDIERNNLILDENKRRGIRGVMNSSEESIYISTLENSRKFEFLEYYKFNFTGEWYFNLIDKLVMMSKVQMGYIGALNKKLGIPPFERFTIGGDGLSNGNSYGTGNEIISFKAYEPQDFGLSSEGNTSSNPLFNKYTVELRYPLSLAQSSTIYFKAFAQGANTWKSYTDFNPFDLKRNVGIGFRAHLPIFGLLGFDYAWPLDKRIDGDKGGKFSIILGFEPE